MPYIPKQGDIIRLDFNPQAGHEQRGLRPALVISNRSFNHFTKTAAMVCPITNTDRGSPVQVKLDNRTKTTGVIMCDQAKILDLKHRNAEFLEQAPTNLVYETIDIIHSFIDIE